MAEVEGGGGGFVSFTEDGGGGGGGGLLAKWITNMVKLEAGMCWPMTALPIC